jgi:hypothetical protein
MKKLAPVLIVLLVTGCATTRTLTFVDGETREPIPNLTVAEHVMRRPYFVISGIEMGKQWLTDENGQVTVTTRHSVQPLLGGGYMLDLCTLEPGSDTIPVLKMDNW